MVRAQLGEAGSVVRSQVGQAGGEIIDGLLLTGDRIFEFGNAAVLPGHDAIGEAAHNDSNGNEQKRHGFDRETWICPGLGL